MLSFADPSPGIHSTLIDPYAELLSLLLEQRINFAKHLGHGGTFLCSQCGICEKKLKIFHLTRIISVSLSSIQPPLMNTNSCLPVQNIGVSVSNTMSLA